MSKYLTTALLFLSVIGGSGVRALANGKLCGSTFFAPKIKKETIKFQEVLFEAQVSTIKAVEDSVNLLVEVGRLSSDNKIEITKFSTFLFMDLNIFYLV